MSGMMQLQYVRFFSVVKIPVFINIINTVRGICLLRSTVFLIRDTLIDELSAVT